MEKKQFTILIPLCIIGFVGFWISSLILGSVPITNSDVYSVKDIGGDSWSYTRSVKNESFTAEIAANPNIELNLADVNAVVESYSGVNITVKVTNTSNEAVKVSLVRKGDDFTSINIGNDSVFGFGLFNFNFGGGSVTKKQVHIQIPNGCYTGLKISQGSGISAISGINALENDIDIGSGEFSLARDKASPADSIKIDLGSGKANFSGMSTQKYDIDIGSGELNISGLTGTGDIDMGSGSARFSFDESPSGSLDMGSGYSIFSLPRDANTKFDFDIGSGMIVVNDGASENMFGHHGGKFYVFGNDSESFKINLGSGKIDIGYTGFTPGTVQSTWPASSSYDETAVQSSAPMYASSSID